MADTSEAPPNDTRGTPTEKDGQKGPSIISIRVSPEDRAKFEDLCKSLGKGTKGDVFHALLACYSVELAKDTEPKIAMLTENFQSHSTALNEIFTKVIETLTDKMGLAEQDYAKQILDLNRKLEDTQRQSDQYSQVAHQQEEVANALRQEFEKQGKELQLTSDLLHAVQQQLSDADNQKIAAEREVDVAKAAEAAATTEAKEARKRADEADAQVFALERRAIKAETEASLLRNELDTTKSILAQTQADLKQARQDNQHFSLHVFDTFSQMGIKYRAEKTASDLSVATESPDSPAGESAVPPVSGESTGSGSPSAESTDTADAGESTGSGSPSC